jgi:hypothetical protein
MTDTSSFDARVNEMNTQNRIATDIMIQIELLETAENTSQCDSARDTSQEIFELWAWFVHYNAPPEDLERVKEYVDGLRYRLATLQDHKHVNE